MKTILKLAMGASAIAMSASVAHAQTSTGSGSASAGGFSQSPEVRNGGDTIDRDAQRARDEAVGNDRRAGKSSGNARNVAAAPDDVQAGAEVRDPKGVLVGRIESVSMSAAVVVTETGKVEVPLEAFGKNKKGLLISMSKADFDKAVAEATKPK